MTADQTAPDLYAPVVSTLNGPTSTGPLLVGVDVGGTKIAVLITTRGHRDDRRGCAPRPARTSVT